MATKKSQRIGIWVIAGAMMIGTLGGFVAMMFAPGNEARDQAALNKAQEEYSAAMTEYQTKVTAQKEQYFDELSSYSSRVGTFDKDSVKELKTEDLKVGDGEEITDDSSLSMFYIGWNPDGKVFDQSIDGNTLKDPFAIEKVSGEGMIEGWKKGIVGMKIGGVRELTIPSAQAYGEEGSGDDIPANTPLKFVVLAVPSISEPEMPQLIKDYYKKEYGVDF